MKRTPFIIRVEFKPNGGFEEVGYYYSKKKAKLAQKRMEALKPVAIEILGNR